MNLTNEEIRIKLAESLAWRKTPFGDSIGDHPRTWRTLSDLPNYPESLDACAEFEKTLTECERRAYFFHLFGTQRLEDGDLWKAVAATPRQRCLAYLKTKGIIQ